MTALTITHSAVATAADDPGAEINKAEWNAAHVLTGSDITGTAGGAAAAGGNIAISGGTGDSGNDVGASITVAGGTGAGAAGTITVTTDGYALDLRAGSTQPSMAAPRGSIYARSTGELWGKVGTADADWNRVAWATGAAGGAGDPGGSLSFEGGEGDGGNDLGATLTIGGGSGTGADGTIELKTGGLTISVLGGTADPSAGGGVAANVASLYARDNGGTVGELWVKTGATDTAWTKVV